MHAIKVLREDHARIEALLEELSAGQTGDGLLQRLERELVIHTLAEDNVFLPQVADAIEDSRKTTAEFFGEDAGELEEASDLISAAYENHHDIRTLLEKVSSDTGWTENAIGGLREAVALQVEIEENLFPKAEKVLEEEDFERIGDLVEHCKWQVRGLAQARLASSSSFRPPAGSKLQTG